MGINNKFDLIFDRTQADVDYASRLKQEGLHSDSDLRGAYNSSDRNRVGGALSMLLELLNNNGYRLVGSVRSNWAEGDIVRAKDNADIIAGLRAVRGVLPQISLEIPDNLDKLDWRKANAVERILFDMYENYDRLSDMWLWCGEGYAGYGYEEHKFDGLWV